jgi:DNA invertase Pin-like site-specific DNA recombinase
VKEQTSAYLEKLRGGSGDSLRDNNARVPGRNKINCHRNFPGCKKVFHEVASGAKTDRAQLRRLLDQLEAGDVLMTMRFDRLARSTRGLLNTLGAITGKKAGFKFLGDTWADTTTSHGRLMLTVVGRLAEFEHDLIRTRTGEGRGRSGREWADHPNARQKREAIYRCDKARNSLQTSAVVTTSARRRFRTHSVRAKMERVARDDRK